MACTTYNCWVNDGKPWSDCQPTKDFVAMLRRHGYTGPGVGIGDQAHLTATPPEDHTPYSHTPWPGSQPYPRILAFDLMPNSGIDILALSGQIFDDKSSGHPALAPLKYMNWTDSAGNCWHDSWQSNHTRYASSDRGHSHFSWRTDYVNSTLLSTYDPLGTGGTSSMLCKYGDGNSGTPSEIVRAMQYMMLKLDPNILPNFGPDGGYGDETARAMSILVSGGPGKNYGAAEYAQLHLLVGQIGGGSGGPATLIPHDHPISLSVSVTGSGSGSGRTGAASPTS